MAYSAHELLSQPSQTVESAYAEGFRQGVQAAADFVAQDRDLIPLSKQIRALRLEGDKT